MQKYFPISEKEARELSRSSYYLFKYFSTLVSANETESKVWDTRHEIAASESPEKFFYVSCGSKRVAIHLLRNHSYTLEVYGFSPVRVLPYQAKHGRYKNYFGLFSDLSSAKYAFADVANQLISSECGALF